jgi:hydroxymethylglutaryl-CoA lyase
MAELERVILEDEVLRDAFQMETRLFSFAEKVRIFHLLKEANVQQEKVLAAAQAMATAGADEVNLADTTGIGDLRQIRSLIRKIRRELPRVDLSLHLHDTRGLGLANMFVGYEEGVQIFDLCAGGLDGCPFVKGAAGNVPTEDAVHRFGAIGDDTGIDLAKMGKVVVELEAMLERHLPGRMSRALRARGFYT